eukprot:TRINITY_DN32878_c0_g1_i1.p1 TRINITY_DN32878_c0_g1~~TRINITY_DN32878_c0_g1_i1.p1  ORF type:complete len:195 (+),score=55.06 TRINITY_DN32878_c0_g1_i1:66-650(+)
MAAAPLDLEEEVARLRAENARLQDDLRAANKLNLVLASERLQQAVAGEGEAGAVRTKELGALRDELAAKTRSCDAYQKKCAELQTSVGEQAAELSALRDELGNLTKLNKVITSRKFNNVVEAEIAAAKAAAAAAEPPPQPLPAAPQATEAVEAQELPAAKERQPSACSNAEAEAKGARKYLSKAASLVKGLGKR